MKKKAVLLSAIFVILLAAVSLNNALAFSIDIFGNGAGSNNSVNFDQQNTSSTTQNNSADVNNNVNVDCNTGGNSASGNSGNGAVSTGDCSANVDISTNVNTNQVDLDCPGCVDSSPSSFPSPSVPPTGGNSGGNGNGGGGNNGGNGAGGFSSPDILGETGTTANLGMFVGGMSMILGGLYTARRQFAKV